MIAARIASSSGGSSLLLRNETRPGGNITFVVDEAFSALTAGLDVFAVALGDYDIDGLPDIFLACRDADRLLRNLGQGRFADVTDSAGVGGPPGTQSSGALFADLNDDGLLDLYVTGFVRNAQILPEGPLPAPGPPLLSCRRTGLGPGTDAGGSGLTAPGRVDGGSVLELGGHGTSFIVRPPVRPERTPAPRKRPRSLPQP